MKNGYEQYLLKNDKLLNYNKIIINLKNYINITNISKMRKNSVVYLNYFVQGLLTFKHNLIIEIF